MTNNKDAGDRSHPNEDQSIFNVPQQQQQKQQQQQPSVTSLFSNGITISTTKPLLSATPTKPIINLANINNNSSKPTTKTTKGLSAKSVLNLSASKATSNTNTNTSHQMTDGIASLCGVSNAAPKLFTRNLSTPILSTTRLSSAHNNSKLLLTQSSEPAAPNPITLTPLQTTKLNCLASSHTNSQSRDG